jgi:hypothetical protein
LKKTSGFFDISKIPKEFLNKVKFMISKKLIDDIVSIKKLLGRLDLDITQFKTDIEKADILIDYILEHFDLKLKKEQLKKDNPELEELNKFEEEEADEYD